MSFSKKAKLSAFIVSSGVLVLAFQNMQSTSDPSSSMPAEILERNGVVNERALIKRSCEKNLQLYGRELAPAKSYLIRSKLKDPVLMTCAQFEKQVIGSQRFNQSNQLPITRTGVLNQSIRLTQKCRFTNTTLVIARSNIIFDGGGSTFTGGEPSKVRVPYGLSLPVNEVDAVKPAKDIAPIMNVEIKNVQFENYSTSGVYLANRFGRKNAVDIDFYDKILGPMQTSKIFDVPGRASPADELRTKSPRRFSIKNVTVRNTKNAAFYIQNSITMVDITESTSLYTVFGVYLDYGTRDINVQNSCFLFASSKDPERDAAEVEQAIDDDKDARREAIAIDSSANNRVVNNLFYKPWVAGIATYKNCWERHDKHDKDKTQMAQFPRRQMSDNNLIQKNIFVGGNAEGMKIGKFGVAIAYRQWKEYAYESPVKVNPTHCGDEEVDSRDNAEGEDMRRYMDYSRNNRILENTFFNIRLPIQIHDDGNQVRDNVFRGNSTKYLVKIGHKLDPLYRKRPIINNIVTGNMSFLNHVTDQSKLVRFGGQSRPYSRIDGNLHNGQAFEINSGTQVGRCGLPIEIQSSNSEEDQCIFDSNAEVVDNGRTVRLIDGGSLVHGEVELVCREGQWEAVSGYCCSGESCRPTARNITGPL